jgi:single-stranded-DNA-specific exonuclease
LKAAIRIVAFSREHMEKTWRIKTPAVNSKPVFPAALNISTTVSTLLTNRGIDTFGSAEKFLNPDLRDLSAPALLPGIPEAVSALFEVINNKERICVYGDYDVDGVTATALLVNTLRELGADVSYYIPHRYHEGYSLNKEAIDELAKKGVAWMITVDCGISDAVEIAYAEEKSIKVIVTDHHNPPEALPKAHVIVDPKCGPADTPYYYLAGVGVAFKLAQALYQEAGKDFAAVEKYLDLVTLGTVADMVPLVGENRILTFFGLQRLAKTVWPGIAMLKKTAGLKENVSTRSIGYALGPRINASGRLEKAEIAVELLLSPSQDAARPFAAQLDTLNKKRQEISARILAEAEQMIKDDPALIENKVAILVSDKWHPGVTGIAASQLVRAYNRPMVLISLEGTSARGSIRSPDDIDIFEGLRSCADLFINYGGHQEAAGFEIRTENIPQFRERYTRFLNGSIDDAMLIPEIKIDLPLPGDQISTELVTDLQRLAPFGQGNEAPVFFSDSLQLVDFRQVGDGSHLKCTFSSGEKTFDGIGFGLGEYAKILSAQPGPIDVAFSLEFNEWNGAKKPQLSLLGIKKRSA